jgi:hypothetical protein
MSNPLHPSVNVCAMCGALVGNQEDHDRWHVRWHDFDVAVIDTLAQAETVISQLVGRVEDISTLQDIDGERIEDLEIAAILEAFEDS